MTEHVTDQLAYYRDLTLEERRAVDAHLATCAECRAMLAVYERQDDALAAIRAIRPRRALKPDRSPIPRRMLARLGDVLALGGLAALIWLFALQTQTMAQGGASAPPASLQPGLTLPPTHIAPASSWLSALPWLAAALLGTGTLFIFTRRSVWPTIIGAMIAAVLLTGFVPPFSALPNPFGLYWRVAGSYSFDAQLPFKNAFIIAGDPAGTLHPQLEKLIGQRGLAPLDPVQPLKAYEILRVGLHPHYNRVALVTTRFIYADGTSRLYPVPLFRPSSDVGGLWLAGWRDDGLERLRSQHLDFPGQPFADSSSPIRFGAVQKLELHPLANRLDEANPNHWLWESVRVERLVVAPDASAFLMAVEVDAGQRQLWLVPLDGGPPQPQPIGAVGDVRAYGFSPDGGFITLTRFDAAAHAADPSHPFAIDVIPRDAASRIGATTLVTGLASDQIPGLTTDGVWFISDGTLWRAPYAGGDPILIRQNVLVENAPRPSPDGARVALVCGDTVLCLADADGANEVRVTGLTPAAMEWTLDGSALAVIDRDVNNFRPLRLWVIGRDGAVRLKVEIAPRDAADPPQWTPDGGVVFVATFVQDGRRIIAVDVASGMVRDLSQEHWDAYFALMPNGQHLLLNNGRGDFWMAEVVR
ncbi:MAG: zf-HC2 domain-containing protein [Anaerolineales bacterium]